MVIDNNFAVNSNADTLSDFMKGVDIAQVRPIGQVKGQYTSKPPKQYSNNLNSYTNTNSDLGSRSKLLKADNGR